jgi:hypothetical protein
MASLSRTLSALTPRRKEEEGGREGGRERGREGGKEGGKEGRREGGRTGAVFCAFQI